MRKAFVVACAAVAALVSFGAGGAADAGIVGPAVVAWDDVASAFRYMNGS